MTPRDRITSSVEFSCPNRIPVHRAIFPDAFFRPGQKLVDFLNAQPDDFGAGKIALPAGNPEDFTASEEFRDEWGSRWVRLKGYTTGQVREPALPTWDNYADYQLPEVQPLENYEKLRHRIDGTDHHFYTLCSGGRIFERLQFIRGIENLFLDLAEDRSELHDLADRIVDYLLHNIEHSLSAGVDACSFGDDWGAQNALLISPEMWRSFFKPRYRKLFQPTIDSGAHIWFHTDGWTFEILDDLIELGVNVINPQHHCMGNEIVAKKIASRACLRSDLDRQHIIPNGTPQEIEDHVKEIVTLFGANEGGLILHGEIGPEVPYENITTLYNAYTKFGTYPLSWLN